MLSRAPATRFMLAIEYASSVDKIWILFWRKSYREEPAGLVESGPGEAGSTYNGEL